MNDGLGFKNFIEWKKFDAYGNLVDSGKLENQVQTKVKESVIDALDTGTMTALQGLGVGTWTGASAASDNLMTFSTASVPTQTQPTATSLLNVSLFTGITGTITEAGLFSTTACTSGMYFYNGALSVALAPTDTLQLSWTVNCTGT